MSVALFVCMVYASKRENCNSQDVGVSFKVVWYLGTAWCLLWHWHELCFARKLYRLVYLISVLHLMLFTVLPCYFTNELFHVWEVTFILISSFRTHQRSTINLSFTNNKFWLDIRMRFIRISSHGTPYFVQKKIIKVFTPCRICLLTFPKTFIAWMKLMLRKINT